MTIRQTLFAAITLNVATIAAGLSFMPVVQAQDPSSCTALLIAQDPNAQINVRSGPGTQYPSPHYALVGDRVMILRGNVDGFAISTDQYGVRWVKVEFPTTKARGWIRRDFIGRFRC
jgi:uncharacterized protein YraI